MVPTWKNAKAVAVLAIIVDECRLGKRLRNVDIFPIERDGGYGGYRILSVTGRSVEFSEHQFTHFIEVAHSGVFVTDGRRTFGGSDYAEAASYVIELLGI